MVLTDLVVQHIRNLKAKLNDEKKNKKKYFF